MQNYKVLKTEFLGEKSIEEYSKINVENGIQTFLNTYKGKKNDLEACKEQLGSSFDMVKGFKTAEAQGAAALNQWIENTCKSDYETILSQFKQLRQNVIDHFCVIKAGTNEDKIAQEYYNGFFNHPEITKAESMFNLH